MDTESNRNAYGYFAVPSGEWRLYDGAVMLTDDDLMDWEEDDLIARCPDMPMAEDLVDYLLALGFDLRNENGQPLGITQSIALTVECAVQNLHGCKMPDMDWAEAEKFGLSLQPQQNMANPPKSSGHSSALIAAEALFKTK
jgi:hypothetical protein